jgi:hypothetical protein
MAIFLVILLISLIATIVSSYFISNSVYKTLVKKNNKNATAVRVLIFILSFIAIAGAIYFLILTNFRIER